MPEHATKQAWMGWDSHDAMDVMQWLYGACKRQRRQMRCQMHGRPTVGDEMSAVALWVYVRDALCSEGIRRTRSANSDPQRSLVPSKFWCFRSPSGRCMPFASSDQQP